MWLIIALTFVVVDLCILSIDEPFVKDSIILLIDEHLVEDRRYFSSLLLSI